MVAAARAGGLGRRLRHWPGERAAGCRRELRSGLAYNMLMDVEDLGCGRRRAPAGDPRRRPAGGLGGASAARPRGDARGRLRAQRGLVRDAPASRAATSATASRWISPAGRGRSAPMSQPRGRGLRDHRAGGAGARSRRAAAASGGRAAGADLPLAGRRAASRLSPRAAWPDSAGAGFSRLTYIPTGWYVADHQRKSDAGCGQGCADQAARRRAGGDPGQGLRRHFGRRALPGGGGDQGRLLPPLPLEGGAGCRGRRAISARWPRRCSRGALPGARRSLARLLGYVAFRREILQGGLPDYTCLLGTMVQEAYASHPAIRAACEREIAGHAATLEPDIAAVMARTGQGGAGRRRASRSTSRRCCRAASCSPRRRAVRRWSPTASAICSAT